MNAHEGAFGGGGSEVRRLEPLIGSHLREVIAEAVRVADESGDVVRFDFNGTEHEVRPGEGYEAAKARAEERCGFPIRTAEAEREDARLQLEEMERTTREAIAAAAVPTEKEMREAEVPWPESAEDLTAYIAALVNRPHDYGTCVYAASMAAVAAFYHVSRQLGMSGFQASCADMDFIRRTRGYKHGFRLIDYGKLLYPQYLDREHFPTWEDLLDGNPDLHRKLAEEAADKLTVDNGVGPVRDHWRWLVATAPLPEPPAGNDTRTPESAVESKPIPATVSEAPE